MYLGLRTVVYPAPDLAAAKAWWTKVLGIEPYFDEPFFVGFSVGGYELGLDPNLAADNGPVTYWGVPDITVALAELVAAGGVVHDEIAEVGEGIKLASVKDAVGSIVGVIENPVFDLAPVPSPGPGL
jgi:predicted enzyme related to lactoylglutathione lyase